MDSDNCDVIIKVLSNVLNRLIDVNKSHVGQQLITKFQSSYPPEVSIHAYLERIKKYAGCSDSCFVVALIYIDRMIEIRNVVLTSLNVHRLIITSLMLAAKFFDDYFYNNAFYAKLGGVASIEMNSLELEFLQLLNFSLFVSPEVYFKYYAELRNYVGVVNIPVYLSAAFPNTPTVDKNPKGNSFLLRPPSTSPFLPLVEIARFPTPPLLDVDFDPNQISQSYFQQILEHNATVPQLSAYESRNTLSKRTFITSSLLPSEKLGNVSFGYNTSSSYGGDQTPVGGHPFSQYCLGSVHAGNQFYSNNSQGCLVSTHFSHHKKHQVNDIVNGQFPQTVVDNDDSHRQEYHFKRLDNYDPYNRPMAPTSDVSCHLSCSTPVSYLHRNLQAMPSCSVTITPPSSYAPSGIHNDSNEEYYRTGKSEVQKECTSQPPYYPMPFPVQQTSQLRDVRVAQPIQVGLSPLDFIRTTVTPQSTCDREANYRFMVQNQKNLSNGYYGDQFYSRPTETSSLSSFSDDNCESGATTPASERSMCSSGGLSSRSSLLSVSSDASICSNSGSGQIFLSQSTGPYYKQLQPPHFITAS